MLFSSVFSKLKLGISVASIAAMAVLTVSSPALAGSTDLDAALKNLLNEQQKKHKADAVLNQIKNQPKNAFSEVVKNDQDLSNDNSDIEKVFESQSRNKKAKKTAADKEVVLEDMMSAQASVVMDANNGKLLYSHNAFRPMSPASLTKIMTAIIVLEACDDLSKTVTIKHNIKIRNDGVAIGLKAGDQVTYEDLLYLALLYSANDSCVALAEELAGSVPEFCKIMNQKAKDIGAINSNFVNPNGMPAANHFTNAYDLAIISQYAMKNEKFARIVGTKLHAVQICTIKEVKVRAKKGKPASKKLVKYVRNIRLKNRHKLLGKVEGVCGIKTGYTLDAGRCLATAYSAGSKNMIIIVLKSKDVVSDTMALVDIDKYQKAANTASLTGRIENPIEAANQTASKEILKTIGMAR